MKSSNISVAFAGMGLIVGVVSARAGEKVPTPPVLTREYIAGCEKEKGAVLEAQEKIEEMRRGRTTDKELCEIAPQITESEAKLSDFYLHCGAALGLTEEESRQRADKIMMNAGGIFIACGAGPRG